MKLLICSAVATILSTVSASAISIQTFDANGDHFVTYDEVVAVNSRVTRSNFRDIDTNRDRRLSSVELEASGAEAILIRGTNPSGTVLSVKDISGGSFVTHSDLAAAYPGLRPDEFERIDTNKDQRVSSSEIYAPDAQVILSQHENTDRVLVSFDRVDADGSGFASLSEIRAVYGRTTRNNLLDIDVNRDGRISFTEFYSPDAIAVLDTHK